MKPPPHNPRNERTVPPFPNRLQRVQSRLSAFHLRDHWWRLLDFFETSRLARGCLYATVIAMIGGTGLWFWAYPAWQKRNSIQIARKWLAAGQLSYAAEVAQRAASLDPENPEPWRIFAELARRGGQMEKALEYSREAVQRAPEDTTLRLAWAADALRANKLEDADTALGRVPADTQDASAHAQRLLGELARRQLRLTVAKVHFEAAIRLEGPLAINEVPLGLILLNATYPAERRRGLDLLARWTPDREWGATALRTLLEDALLRGSRPDMRRFAEALRTHPGCTLADMPRCLLALSQSDEARFAEVVAGLERDHAVTPQAAAQLLSWLNQIGRGAEGARWMLTLPPAGMRRPPLAVVGAEALRQASDWTGLRDWTTGADWGAEAEFLRWTYAMLATRRLGDDARAQELWQTLLSHGDRNGTHGLFTAALIYSWGLGPEAETLWWRLNELGGTVAVEALGALARHYQVQRDADGQYRVFRRLHLLQPGDPAVGNNFAFFAILTGREQRVAETVARANLTAAPGNRVYAATYAFVQLQIGRAADALQTLAPWTAEAVRSPELGFVYGLTLAGIGRNAEARALLAPLPRESLTTREVELLAAALGG